MKAENGMKYCPACQRTKPATKDNFSINNSKSDKLDVYCKPCDSKRSSRHHLTYKVVRRDRKDRARRFVWEYYKLLGGCQTCHEQDCRVLQADHRDPKTKRYNISNMVGKGMSNQMIAQELAKCDILCSNCHIRRTCDQFNFHSRIK